jgi:hypothetical protein
LRNMPMARDEITKRSQTIARDQSHDRFGFQK